MFIETTLDATTLNMKTSFKNKMQDFPNCIDEQNISILPMKPYGYELILDLHGCDSGTFKRDSIENFFKKLCKQIKMTRCDLHFWDDVGVPQEEQQTSPHTKGTSAVQFILTSTIVIHTLDLMGAAYINIFSCKEFDKNLAEVLSKEWFKATDCRSNFIERH